MKNEYEGKLIVFDGLQRSGKSTVARKIYEFLNSNGRKAIYTEWNSHPYINPIIDKKKDLKDYTPMTWFGLHYVDFILRYEEEILPALKNGYWVVCDRYFFTSFSRDSCKGIQVEFLKNVFNFCLLPDITFFFMIRPETVYQRHKKSTDVFHLYNSGMDIYGGIESEEKKYLRYQNDLVRIYEKMAKAYGAVSINGEESQIECYETVKDLIIKQLC